MVWPFPVARQPTKTVLTPALLAHFMSKKAVAYHYGFFRPGVKFGKTQEHRLRVGFVLVCVVTAHYPVEIPAYSEHIKIESGAFSGPGCDYAYLVSSFSESLEQLRYIREKLYQLVIALALW